MAQKLRRGANADASGSYQPIILIKNAKVNPGARIDGEIFITGYGAISSAKLAVYSSLGLFVDEASTYKSGFGERRDGDRLHILQGHQETQGGGNVLILFEAAVVREDSIIADPFSDSTRDLVIFSETRAPQAPLSFSLKLHERCSPGTYQLAFGFTYFNGTEWCSEREEKQFVVRSLIDRIDWRAAALFLTAAAVSMVADLPGAIISVSRLLHLIFPL
ncbi:hypothetical protein CURE108131_23265 [Cupriavidus respiraculi]|uniref:DUF8164 domain-containing protein n=1 Tax=Cupriavidus respiraculi TaxID=195930 RepID=A0ABN7YFZ1_9BURK|nr:hypothetical protein [Cupriavidus respiraculi]CAG9172344.1 hypothetical protein LMG21510_01943 [Cupriavidus respiraculi]